MAEALAALLAQRYRTAKDLARAARIDISTAENLRTNLVRLRSQAAELLARAPSLDEAGQGSAAHPVGGSEARSWDRSGGAGNLGTPRSRDRGGR